MNNRLNDSNAYDYHYNIILIGSFGVGKTTLHDKILEFIDRE